MVFVVGTLKEARENKFITITHCSICKNKIKSDAPVLVQYDLLNTTEKQQAIHIKCLMHSLQRMQPDFWKRYIVELI